MPGVDGFFLRQIASRSREMWTKAGIRIRVRSSTTSRSRSKVHAPASPAETIVVAPARFEVASAPVAMGHTPV